MKQRTLKILTAILLLLLLRAPKAWAAWTADGSAACANQDEASSSTTLICTFANNSSNAGDVLVVVCAGDNVSGSGNTNDHGAVTDSGGNTYTKAYEFTEGTDGTANGATVSVHFSKTDTGLTAGSSTITCNYNTAVTDRAMHLVRKFTITSGNTVSVAGTPQGEESNGGDAGALTISGLTSGEYLFVRGIATESNNATILTPTTNYLVPQTPGDGCNNTTTGAEASDMGACSEFRILTGTGDTSNPTLADTTNDNASVYVALAEAAPAGMLRRMYLLKLFEDPLQNLFSGPKWFAAKAGIGVSGIGGIGDQGIRELGYPGIR